MSQAIGSEVVGDSQQQTSQVSCRLGILKEKTTRNA